MTGGFRSGSLWADPERLWAGEKFDGFRSGSLWADSERQGLEIGPKSSPKSPRPELVKTQGKPLFFDRNLKT